MDSTLHLLVVGNTTRQFVGGWRLPGEGAGVEGNRETIFRLARLAEEAKFDGLFFTDPLNFGDEATWPYKRTDDFEPLTAAAALSAVTGRLERRDELGEGGCGELRGVGTA